MTSELWARVEKAFQAATELSPEEARARLHEICGGDEEVKREVASLLAFDGFGATVAREAVLEEIGTLAEEQNQEMVGRRLGNYSVTRVLGAGGMGTVFEATRADAEFEKRVAIKLIRAELATETARKRFLEERQILATLEHPHIARLIDGGTHGNTPYLVMELVEGVPLTKWCENHAPRIRQRLLLFLDLCAAVQYAHQKLVVHRDLKPANVLVTASGQVKLLDFGIAKLIDPAFEKGETAALPLSPDYASPEQVRGEFTGPASDIYSLGAILFELLTGAKPHRLTTYSPAEVAKAVCELEPVAASQAAPDRRRELQGDLDAIVQKAMRKEADARYGSVEQLAADVSHHLEGRPVLARKGTWTYRATRFLRRNALAVAAVTLIIASLTGGLVAYRIQSRRTERRFDQVRALANTLMFGVYDKLTNVPGATDARQFVAETSQKYLDSLSADAGSEPLFRLELAHAYLRLALVQNSAFDASVGHQEQALANYRKTIALGEPCIPDVATGARARKVVGQTYMRLAVEEGRLGDLDASLAHTARSIEILTPLLRAGGKDAIFAMQSILAGRNTEGDTWLWRNEPAKAEQAYRQALDISLEAAKQSPRDIERLNTTYPMARLSVALRDQGDVSQAHTLLEQAVGISEQLHRRDPGSDVFARSLAVHQMELTGLVCGAWNPSVGGSCKEAADRALAEFVRFAAADPKDMRARSELAEFRVMAAGFERSRAMAETGLEFFRGQPLKDATAAEAFSVTGWLQTRAGEAAGLDLLRQAVEILDKQEHRTPQLVETLLPIARMRYADGLERLDRAQSAGEELNGVLVALKTSYGRTKSVRQLQLMCMCQDRLAALDVAAGNRGEGRKRWEEMAGLWAEAAKTPAARDYATRMQEAALQSAAKLR